MNIPVYVTRPLQERGYLKAPQWAVLLVARLAWLTAVAWGILGLVEAARVAF